MQRGSFGVLAASAALLVAAMPDMRDHSFAAVFDANQPVTVRGVITAVRLENPHCVVFPRREGRQRQGREMELRGQHADLAHSAAALKPGTIKAGDEVTVKGYHARDASQNAGAAREIVMSDGRAFAVGPLVGPGGR